MAQFDYLGTWTDSWKLIHSILDRPGIRLLADLWYRVPEPLFIARMDAAAEEVLRNRRRVFIWGDDFSQYPPVLTPVHKDRADTLYTAEARKGGPSLDLSLPACYEEEGFVNLAHGMFSYHTEYQNPETGAWVIASAELKAGYRDILGRMKRHLVRHRFHELIWTGPDALRLLQEGKARISGFGLKSPKTYQELRKGKGDTLD